MKKWFGYKTTPRLGSLNTYQVPMKSLNSWSLHNTLEKMEDPVWLAITLPYIPSCIASWFCGVTEMFTYSFCSADLMSLENCRLLFLTELFEIEKPGSQLTEQDIQLDPTASPAKRKPFFSFPVSLVKARKSCWKLKPQLLLHPLCFAHCLLSQTLKSVSPSL